MVTNNNREGHTMTTATMTKNELYDALDKAETEGRMEGHYSYSPGDGWTRYVVWGQGVERTYKRREVVAFLESGKALWAFEYPEQA